MHLGPRFTWLPVWSFQLSWLKAPDEATTTKISCNWMVDDLFQAKKFEGVCITGNGNLSKIT